MSFWPRRLGSVFAGLLAFLSIAVAPGLSAQAAAGLPAEMVDVTWEWVSFTTPVEEITVDVPERYTMQLTKDGNVALQADCNRGMTSYTAGSDGKLTFSGIALTRAMCPQGSLSNRFVREVERASSYFLRDGDLFLELPVDSGTLRFRRQD
jgi:heat shock protein HslJ